MRVTLPYEFDSTALVKLILRGVLGLLLVVVPGVLYSLFFSNILGTVALLWVAGIVIYLGRRVHKNVPGSRGTISADAPDTAM
jgi:hypothetical protein